MFVGVFACLLAVVTAVPGQHGGFPNLLENAIPVGRDGKESRIVGGSDAEKHEFPWQASFQYFSESNNEWSHFCGGSLVSPNWVITAAHCMTDWGNTPLRMVLGDHSLNTISDKEQEKIVSNLVIHENYNGEVSGFPNDIGLVELESSVTFNDYVQPVDYATSFSSYDECFISGWGRTAADEPGANTLKKSDMEVMTNSACRRFWGSSIRSSHVCINDANSDSSACMGDSGGPLVCSRNGNFYLIGLTSWGSSTCHTSYPNVYTRISSFVNWVDAIVKN